MFEVKVNVTRPEASNAIIITKGNGVESKSGGGKFMKFRLIDDPLCDVNEDIPAYENCEDCPYFWDCMEEDDEDEM